MAVMDVRNDSTGWLTLWLEPLGEDRWLKPGERLRVRSDYRGDDLAFSVDLWTDEEDRAAGIENIAVWIEAGDCYAEVTDAAGDVVECGHQRPVEISRKWTASREEARRRIDSRTAPESS
ncbi:hypothetical protein AB0F07_19115 [Streptomyces fructofermentans]|uniref:hypothetical protein n=1 Tax=Streptomyces fructofermentans TaxID=152141 RepID=UPI0033E998F7